MVSSFIALGLAGLAAAAPSQPDRRQTPIYYPQSQSNAFTLVVNVTDLSKDFSPSINHFVLNSYHSGAGTAFAVVTAPTADSPGRLFYQNGTANEAFYGNTTVLTDGGSPLSPYAIIVQGPDEQSVIKADQHDVYINAGYGTKGVGITRFPEPIPTLYRPYPDSAWAVCKNELLYGEAYQLEPTFADPNNNYEQHIPEGCVAIKLIAQCATLNDVPSGSYSSHEFADTVGCYDNVSAIDWTVYASS